MHLTLVLPNLLDASPAALAVADAAALSRLLSTEAAPPAHFDGLLAIACAGLGIARQYDWPAAPWLARAAGIDPGDRYWLRAEPASLKVGRVDARLAGIVGDLDADDSAALLSTLRAHFMSDGIEWVEREPGSWWFSLAEPQRIETSPPDAAFGKPLIAHLPRGDDAARWHRWQSEMQMLLFEHPVNRAREMSGRLAANHVWIWGGGTLGVIDPAMGVRSVFAASTLLTGLARAVGAQVAAVPASFASFRAAATQASALVWLDPLDPLSPEQGLTAFDHDWAAPLERALDKRELDLRLVIGGSSAALSFTSCARTAMQRLRHRWSPPPRLGERLAAIPDA